MVQVNHCQFFVAEDMVEEEAAEVPPTVSVVRHICRVLHMPHWLFVASAAMQSFAQQ